MALITTEQAKLQVRLAVDGSPADVEDETIIELMIEQATEIVVTRLQSPGHGWTVDTVPADIQAAILNMFAYLYRHRGDGDTAFRSTDGRLPNDVEMYLYRHRDPPLA